MTTRNGWTRLNIALYAAIAIFCLCYLGHIRKERSGAFGRYTAQEVMRRAEAIRQVVAHDVASVSLSVAPLDAGRHSGRSRRFWQAALTDDQGADIGHITWDADTGDLLLVSRAWLTPSGNRPLDRRGAEQAAAYWLSRAGFAAEATGWRQIGEARSIERDRWRVQWRAADREVMVVVDGASGGLALAKVAKPDPIRPSEMASVQSPH